MTFAYKLSRRLAQNFWVVGAAATLAACAGELTQPVVSTSPVKTVSINPSTASVAVNGVVQLSATLRDSTGAALAGRAVNWTSEAAAIATVSEDGVVRGASAGTATIRAVSEGKTASATVTVTSEPTGGSGAHAGFHVAPSGSSAGDGSAGRPWDLATALAGAGGRVQAGDTVWLHGGTYRGTFASTAGGTSGKPIVFRQYPGERAVIDGAGAARNATILNVKAPWVVFWGFEITNTDSDRTWPQTGNGGRPHALANYAPHTKYIALTVHDAGVAIYNDPRQFDVEIVGSVFYNNGWQGPDRGHGHAIYLRSNTGPVIARENIMFNQFGYGVHVYTNSGDGLLNNIRIEGNVSFNNGTLANNSSASNILVGGADRADDDVVTRNMTYFSPGVASTNLKIGYGTLQNGSVEITSNYAAGGNVLLNLGYWSSVTASGNTFLGTGSLVKLNDPDTPSSLFSGQASASLPTATKVFVRRVPYETGRANIVVYNWGRQGSVSADLDGIVPVGKEYQIHNVQNLRGAPVASGIFGGGSVTVPIESVPSPAPVGWSRGPSTGTEFAVYVVTIRE